MGVLNVTATDFEQEVLKADLPVLVDFWAEWCGPCKMVAPVVDKIAEKNEGKLKVVKVNVDQAQELAGNYQVMSIPTLIIFKGGAPVDQVVGAVSEEQLSEKVSAQL